MDDWVLIKRSPGSAGYLPVEAMTFRLPDGSISTWDVFGRRAAVAVLALSPERHVILARQFRPGPGRILDELPGGYVEDRETVIDAAARELREETGYVGDLEFAGSTWLAANSRTQRFVVVAREAHRVSDSSPDVGEFCETRTVPMSEFRRLLRSGEMTDVDLAYLALDHLGVLNTPRDW